jgi:polyvinyl alcohol dehydrogenase (cytochrome)
MRTPADPLATLRAARQLGVAGGFAGGAFVKSSGDRPSTNGLVYAAAGNLYAQPDAVTACLATKPDGWDEAAFPPGAYFNSVVRLRPAHREAALVVPGRRRRRAPACPAGACLPEVTWVSAADRVQRMGLRRIRRQRLHGPHRPPLAESRGIGQKSGVYWALDAASGRLLWTRLVGPARTPGDSMGHGDGRPPHLRGHRHNTGEPYTLPSGEVITGGSWAALDPGTGEILWQTPDPQGAPDLASLTVANGVLYGGSMAHTGDQMYALDTRSGRILWRFAAGGSVVGGPAVVDGRLLGLGVRAHGGLGNDKFYVFRLPER